MKMLKEDVKIEDQQYACISFLMPYHSNDKIIGVKNRGNFATHAEAKEHAIDLSKVDKNFGVYVGEVGKWLPIDTKKNSKMTSKQLLNDLQKTMHKTIKQLAKEKKLQAQRKGDMIRKTLEENKKIKEGEAVGDVVEEVVEELVVAENVVAEDVVEDVVAEDVVEEVAKDVVSKAVLKSIDAKKCLTKDAPMSDQKYSLFSFLDPRGLRNSSVIGVKFRGNYETRDEAEKYASELQSTDANFDIYIGNVGKWERFNPNLDKIKDKKYHEKELQSVIDGFEQNASRIRKLKSEQNSDMTRRLFEDDNSTNARLKRKLQKRRLAKRKKLEDSVNRGEQSQQNEIANTISLDATAVNKSKKDLDARKKKLDTKKNKLNDLKSKMARIKELYEKSK